VVGWDLAAITEEVKEMARKLWMELAQTQVYVYTG